MKPDGFKPYYRRNLPHIQPLGDTFFVTFRLHGSLPQAYILKIRREWEAKSSELKRRKPKEWMEKLQQERWRFFQQYDQLLDSASVGPVYLKEEKIAEEVKRQLHRFDGELYTLMAYCIMPNHVHVLLDTGAIVEKHLEVMDLEQLEFLQLHRIMHRIKGASARYCNQILGEEGKFWQKESFDQFIRNERHLNNVLAYILENPVHVRLVKCWEDWPHSYLIAS